MRSKIYPLKNSLSQGRHLSHAMFLRDESMEWFVCFENDSSWITINDRDEQFCCRSCLSSKQSKTSQLWDSCHVVPFCLVFFLKTLLRQNEQISKSQLGTFLFHSFSDIVSAIDLIDWLAYRSCWPWCWRACVVKSAVVTLKCWC